MLRRSFTLTNSNEELLRGDLRHREDAKNAPAIIICHGFKGYKDWGFFPLLAESLASAGYVAITFNFSRNGLGADLQNFTELEKFARNTYSHELDDLKCVIDCIANKTLGKGLIDLEKLGLMGHSRGGAIAILHASKDNRIQTLVTWSAIATVDRYSQEEIDKWEKNGYIEIENKRTKQMMRINSDLLLDIRENKESLNILNAASKLEIPALIVHGDMDESVNSNETEQIFEHITAPSKELMIIEGATHTYGISHPMESISEQFTTVLDLTESWFDRYLNI
jgi:dienelactone hydrolase